MPLRLLVIDAYSPNARNKLPDFGVSHAGTLMASTAKLHQADVQTDVSNFDIGDDVTLPNPADYDGVMWTGSNMTIHRRNPLIDAQIDFAQNVYDAGTPQFGVCWALQLATVAAGGDVQANPKGPEIGWARDITVNDVGLSHPMFAGKAAQFDGKFDALCWHNDAVITLPDDATLLASNDMAPVQAAVIRHSKGEFWATQYHVEYDGREVARLMEARAEGLVEDGVFDGLEEMQAAVAEMDQLKRLEETANDAPAPLQPVINPMIRTAEMGNWLRHIDG